MIVCNQSRRGGLTGHRRG